MTLKVLAHAKINRFLHINGKRSDGRHNLQTLFQLLNYGDDLSFTLTDKDIHLTHIADDGVNIDRAFESDDNLILKAAKSLKQHCSIQQGVNIQLIKRIPLGGGLGGGSSNAASTLLALNELWQCRLSKQRLSTLGQSLGADVPIFIGQHTALAEGTGEQLFPVSTPRQWFIIVNPGIFVSTARIFNHCELTRDTSRIKIRDLEEQLPKIVDNCDLVTFKNDCQKVAEQCYPELKACRQRLNSLLNDDVKSRLFNGEFQMTGTGSSYFAAFPDAQTAQQLFQPIQLLAKTMKWRCFVAEGVNHCEW